MVRGITSMTTWFHLDTLSTKTMTRRSPIQERILNLLQDGNAHPREEVLSELQDSEATFKNLWPHIFRLRKTLEPRGESIICELRGRKILYRHVRLLPSAVDGVH